MKIRLFTILAMVACAGLNLMAMPTENEMRQAAPRVRNLLSKENAALKAGKMTRSEVADSAMKLSDKADDEASKLLFLKGAFILYARDGKVEKAIETLDKIELSIADISAKNIASMIDLAISGEDFKSESLSDCKSRLLAKRSDFLNKGDRMKEVANGYTWSYRIENGKATIIGNNSEKGECAISLNPTGIVKVPSVLGGVPVTTIGKSAFHDCNLIASLTFPKTLESIEDGAFNGCNRLTTLEIPEGVTNIGGWAIAGCEKLEFVSLPASLKTLGMLNFWCCPRLQRIDVSSENENFASVDGVLYTKDKKGVVACPWAKDMVTLVPCVEVVKWLSFQGCEHLEALTLPKSVKTIESSAFKGCSKLKSLTFTGERPSAGELVFEACQNIKEIHVPVDAKSWKGMTEWLGIPLVFDSNEEREEMRRSLAEMKAQLAEQRRLRAILGNTQGLIHRWDFNGTLEDSVGGRTASLVGEVKQEDKQIVLAGGVHGSSYVDLGRDLFTGNDGWTIEIWGTEKSVKEWGRIFNIGLADNDILMSWSMGNHQPGSVYCRLKDSNSAASETCPIPLNTELHISMVIEPSDGEGNIVHVYIQDASIGNMMWKKDFDHHVSAEKLAGKGFYLGHAAGTPWNEDANAAYNEVRIWNRALSEEELTQNAIKFHKAGETMKK